MLAWASLCPLVYTALVLSPKHSFYAGWFSGTIAFVGFFYWFMPFFQADNVPIFVGLLSLGLVALLTGLGWGIWTVWLSMCRSTSIIFSVLAAAAWASIEYLITGIYLRYPGSLTFLLGYTQWHNLPLIQIASIAGVYGISFLVALVNVTIGVIIYDLVGDPPTPPFAKERYKKGGFHIVVAATAVLATFFYGQRRLHSYSTASEQGVPIHVALLQGNDDQYQKWDVRRILDIAQAYGNLCKEAAAFQKPDLIVWPETSVPGWFPSDPNVKSWLEKLVRQTGTYHVVGVSSLSVQGNRYDAAFALGPGGEILGEYDKVHLLTFGEIITWSYIQKRFFRAQNDWEPFTAGRRSSVLQCAGAPIGVSICNEVFYPNAMRQSVRQGATLLANLTNDAWYLRTAEPYQHFVPNVFRAVENDRWLMQAASTGITGIVNPRGQVLATSQIFVPAMVRGAVYPRTTLTFYSRYGDLFAWICAAISLLVFYIAARRRTSARRKI